MHARGQRDQPWVRALGDGPGVVCLHANASTSAQWRGLMELLSPRFRMLAPDLYGAGRSPDWPSDRAISLADEADLVQPVLANAGPQCALVGHSYGAAVALKLALQLPPGRIRALALYEPTLFSLVDQATPRPNAVDGIRDTVLRAGAALDRDEPEHAARCFIDYWNGAGAWDAMTAEHRAGILPAVANVRRWGHALFSEPAPPSALRRLDMPVLLIAGSETTVAARAVLDILRPQLPKSTLVTVPGAGHMGPLTHADLVNQTIADFLAD